MSGLVDRSTSTGRGKVFPELSTVSAVTLVNSVKVPAATEPAVYSTTLAPSVTLSPTATVGAALVKTKTPSEVAGSPSPTGSCR